METAAEEDAVTSTDLRIVIHREGRIHSQNRCPHRVAAVSSDQSIDIAARHRLESARQEDRVPIADFSLHGRGGIWKHGQGCGHHGVAAIHSCQRIHIAARSRLEGPAQQDAVPITNLSHIIHRKGRQHGHHRCQDRITAIPRHQSIDVAASDSLESPAGKHAVPITDADRHRARSIRQDGQLRSVNGVAAAGSDQAVHIETRRGLESTRQEDGVAIADGNGIGGLDGSRNTQEGGHDGVTRKLRSQGVHIAALCALESAAEEDAVARTNIGGVGHGEDRIDHKGRGHHRITAVAGSQGVHVSARRVLEGPAEENAVSITNHRIRIHLNIRNRQVRSIVRTYHDRVVGDHTDAVAGAAGQVWNDTHDGAGRGTSKRSNDSGHRKAAAGIGNLGGEGIRSIVNTAGCEGYQHGITHTEESSRDRLRYNARSRNVDLAGNGIVRHDHEGIVDKLDVGGRSHELHRRLTACRANHIEADAEDDRRIGYRDTHEGRIVPREVQEAGSDLSDAEVGDVHVRQAVLEDRIVGRNGGIPRHRALHTDQVIEIPHPHRHHDLEAGSTLHRVGEEGHICGNAGEWSGEDRRFAAETSRISREGSRNIHVQAIAVQSCQKDRLRTACNRESLSIHNQESRRRRLRIGHDHFLRIGIGEGVARRLRTRLQVGDRAAGNRHVDLSGSGIEGHGVERIVRGFELRGEGGK